MINKDNIESIYNCFARIDEDETIKWLDKINDYILDLSFKWELCELEIFPKGRLGILISAYSYKYKSKVILKMIPRFIGIYEIEKNAYLNLSDKYMCKLFDYSDDTQTLLLKRISDIKPIVYEDDYDLLFSYFNTVYNNLICSDSKHTMILEYKKNIKFAKKFNFMKEERNKITNICLKLYKKFSNESLYLLHYDLHEGNLLREEDKIYAIDPLGYSAPKEFCFARFVIVKLFYGKDEEIRINLERLVDFVSNWVSKEYFLDALLIDCDFFINTAIVEFDIYERIIPKMIKIANIILNKIESEE